MHKIILEIRKDLKKNVDENYRKNTFSFFKEPIKCYGVRNPVARKIAKKYFAKIEDKNKKEICSLCEELLRSDFNEEATIAFEWIYNLRKQFEAKDFAVFESWIKKYVNNWAKCDDFCTHSVGEIILQYPEYLEDLKTWAKSKNRWVRRASAVTLILPARKGKFIKEAFEIADILFYDKDDLVQKGYGWLLKEVTKLHEKEVLEYVIKHKIDMPRTALRYAIEKMSKDKKALAMK